MKAKWCIVVFIVALLFAANQQQNALPNQEIVLQFTNKEVTSADVQHAIEAVKKQLYSIGVNNLKVQEHKNGTLKITYYSNTDVDSIEALLSEGENFKLGAIACNNEKEQPKRSSNKNNTIYSLDVFEIQTQDTGSGLGGMCAVVSKSDKNPFLNPLIPISETNIDRLENNFEGDRSNSTYVVSIITNTSLKIPEGRAGPFAKG